MSSCLTDATTANVTAFSSRDRPAAERPTRPLPLQAGVPGDRLGALGGAAREQPGDLRNETGLQFQILASPSLGVPFPASHPGVGVGEALLFGLLERWFLHQEALPLVPLARPAPPDHHRGQGAGLLRPAGQRGVA